MRKNIFIIVLCVAAIGVFLGIMFQVKWLDYLFKPMIMISIAGHFLIHSKNIDKKLVRLALFAFLFSLLGDSFLMFTESGMLYFILGLSSFLTGQIFYIILFHQSIKIENGESFLRKNYLYLIAYVVYGLIVYFLLFNHLDNILKIAVFVYIVAIVTMSAMALNRHKVVRFKSFFLVFSGSLLFVVSDTLIALDKFLMPIPNDRIFVMSTYIVAQYFIMSGILKQFDQ